MKLIAYLQSLPVDDLILIIITLCITIICMIVYIVLRLSSHKKVTKAAQELNNITNRIRAGLVNFVYEDNCRIVYASRGFYELLEYTREEINERGMHSLLDFVDPRDKEGLEVIKKQLQEDTLYIEVRMITKFGDVMMMLINGNSERGRDGKHTILAVFIDVTEQKKLEKEILLEGERYRVAAELSNDVLLEYHIKTDQMVYTNKYRDQFGRTPVMESFCETCYDRRDLVHPDDWGVYVEFCRSLIEGKRMIVTEYRMKDKMKEFIWCQIRAKTIFDDKNKPIRVIGKIVNIDAQKRELEALEYKATRDPLTGVYNKEVTIKKIDKYISGNRKAMHIVMFIDFDDFKKINDNYGHLLGDKVLIYVIGRIKGIFSDGEIVGRIGGDEFVVFAGDVEDMDGIHKKAEALAAALNTIYIDKGHKVPISGSIGIASYPEHGTNYEKLIGCADIALYEVKGKGKKGYKLYSGDTN